MPLQVKFVNFSKVDKFSSRFIYDVTAAAVFFFSPQTQSPANCSGYDIFSGE
jgi:hypothetical protein